MYPMTSVVAPSATSTAFHTINDSLSQTIKLDDVEKFKILLSRDPTLYTSQDKYGRSLIAQVIAHRRWLITQYLLHEDRTHHSDLFKKNAKEQTALYYACATNWDHSEDVLLTLLAHHLDPFEIDTDGASPVMLLMNTNAALVPILIANKKVNTTPQQLFFAIIYALRNNLEISLVQLLSISDIATLNYQEEVSGNSLLHYAVEYNNLSAAELLIIQGIDVNLLNKSQLLALACAYTHNNIPMCQLLLKYKSQCDRGSTINHIYAAQGARAIEDLVRAHRLSVETPSVRELCLADSSLETLLPPVVPPASPRPPLRNVTWFSWVTPNSTRSEPMVRNISVSDLLQNKLYVNMVPGDPDGNTYLHYMTTTDGVTKEDLEKIESMNWLQIRNKFADPPLHFCIRTGKMNHIRCLMQVKDALVTNGDNNNALHTAARYNGFFVSHIMAILPSQAKAKNNSGMTPLHIAAQFGNAIAVQALLSQGSQADPNALDRQGNSPLQLLAHAEINSNITTLIATNLVRKMTNVCGVNKQEETALHTAVRQKKTVLVAWLLDKTALAATINNANKVNEIPLVIACQNKDEDMVKLLVKHDALRYDPSAVIAACRSNNEPILSLLMTKYLILEGKKISCKRADPNCVLQIGHNQTSPLIEAVKSQATACVKYLLAQGAKPHKIASKDSILKIAIEANAVDSIPLLVLHKKVKITLADYDLAAKNNQKIKEIFDSRTPPKQRGRSNTQSSGTQSRSRSNSASRALDAMVGTITSGVRRLSFSRSDSMQDQDCQAAQEALQANNSYSQYSQNFLYQNPPP